MFIIEHVREGKIFRYIYENIEKERERELGRKREKAWERDSGYLLGKL